MKDHKRIIFLVLIAILAYLFYLMMAPYMTFILLGLVLVIALKPLYELIHEKIKYKKLSSWLTIIIVLLIVIIPSFFLGAALIKETTIVFANIDIGFIKEVANYVTGMLGIKSNIEQNMGPIIANIGDFMIKSSLSMMSSFIDAIIGLFIMFSIMYYGFMDGGKWIDRCEAFIPFTEKRKKGLMIKITKVIKSALYGEILISIIQGTLGGIGLYLAGIDNPIFWGFIMAVLAFLPFVGTGCVWLPAAIFQMMNHNTNNGIFLIVYGIVIVTGVDYIIRPEIISAGSEIHPLIALIGAFGGLQIFGFIGLILGPLMAALFATIVQFYYEDYVKKKRQRI